MSGCVNISTNLSVTGPDRLKISLDIYSNSGESIPWQMEFEENLSKKHSILKLQTHEDKQHFESPTIRFEEVNKLLPGIQANDLVSTDSRILVDLSDFTKQEDLEMTYNR